MHSAHIKNVHSVKSEVICIVGTTLWFCEVRMYTWQLHPYFLFKFCNNFLILIIYAWLHTATYIAVEDGSILVRGWLQLSRKDGNVPIGELLHLTRQHRVELRPLTIRVSQNYLVHYGITQQTHSYIF